MWLKLFSSSLTNHCTVCFIIDSNQPEHADQSSVQCCCEFPKDWKVTILGPLPGDDDEGLLMVLCKLSQFQCQFEI